MEMPFPSALCGNLFKLGRAEKRKEKLPFALIGMSSASKEDTLRFRSKGSGRKKGK